MTPSPLGGQALGSFGNESVLKGVMDALPAGDDIDFEYEPRTVVLSFDLLLLGPWVGSRSGEESLFEITASDVAGSSLVLSTTFSNGGDPQSYPGPFPGDPAAAGTGAFYFDPGALSAYAIEVSFPLHSAGYNVCCSDLGVGFSASGLAATATWQLDNVILDWSQPIPEPGTALLLGAGLALLAGRRRNSRRPHAQFGRLH